MSSIKYDGEYILRTEYYQISLYLLRLESSELMLFLFIP